METTVGVVAAPKFRESYIELRFLAVVAVVWKTGASPQWSCGTCVEAGG